MIQILKEILNSKYKFCANLIIRKYNSNYYCLLGLSTAADERKDKYVFPGGHIEFNESIYDAGIREAIEESNIQSELISNKIFEINDKTCCILSKYINGKIKPNNEFSNMKWFNLNKLPNNILESNKLIIQQIFQK